MVACFATLLTQGERVNATFGNDLTNIHYLEKKIFTSYIRYHNQLRLL